MFSIFDNTNSSFRSMFILSSANALNLDQSKIVSSGKKVNRLMEIQLPKIQEQIECF